MFEQDRLWKLQVRRRVQRLYGWEEGRMPREESWRMYRVLCGCSRHVDAATRADRRNLRRLGQSVCRSPMAPRLHKVLHQVRVEARVHQWGIDAHILIDKRANDLLDIVLYVAS